MSAPLNHQGINKCCNQQSNVGESLHAMATLRACWRQSKILLQAHLRPFLWFTLLPPWHTPVFLISDSRTTNCTGCPNFTFRCCRNSLAERTYSAKIGRTRRETGSKTVNNPRGKRKPHWHTRVPTTTVSHTHANSSAGQLSVTLAAHKQPDLRADQATGAGKLKRQVR